MSSSANDSASKASAASAVRTKIIQPNASAAETVRRFTLNQATRAQLDSSFGVKCKTGSSASSRCKPFSNAKPQALTGLLGLSTCNSGFLNSLMADVAKAKEGILRAKRGQGASSSSSPQMKRRRISMPENANESPVQQINRPLLQAAAQQPSSFLDLLWEESWLKPAAFGSGSAAAAIAAARLNPRPAPRPAPVAPPVQEAPRRPAPTIIPATASEANLAARAAALQKPSSNMPIQMETEEGGFGWYIDMDEDEDYPPSNSMNDDSHRRYSAYAGKGSTDTLAFSAPTAPKASNHDAQVEWAKAADTVDDVLGDLF